MRTIRWGIIGCGDVTEVKSGPAFQKVPGSALVAVMRRDASKAEDYARRHGVARWYDDADRLISDPVVDAVYVATPPGSHADYVARVARAGKPVYVEKPMARTYAECRSMIDACTSVGVPLFVAYYRRAQPSFVKVRELLDAKAIGDVRLVHSALWHPCNPEEFRDRQHLPWRVVPELSGGGIFYDLACHQLDIFDFLLGPIDVTSIKGIAANQAGLYDPEDVVSAAFRFESGVMGTGSWCFTVGPAAKTDRVEIVGSRGSISFSIFGHSRVVLLRENGSDEFDLPPSRHVQEHLIRRIVGQLQGIDRSPSDGESAARTNRVMEAMVPRP